MTAAAQDQWRLLDVQSHDTRLTQIAHRQRTLPAHARITELEGKLSGIDDEMVVARTAATDAARELAKAEGDVEQVRQRVARNQARLDAGQGSAKDLQAIQHELESLANRQSVLEDAELEVMERQEAAQTAVAAATTRREAVTAEIAEAAAERDKELAALSAEADAEKRDRENAAAGIPKDLLALYERIRETNHGVGAAKLYQRRCEACRITLPPSDLARIRAAAENAVVRCEECSRILVRTAESGL
ncbi:zinc ribbon domain-containing protein [Kineosporia corallincola]|uniref:zinc ribbon domain-containing protein n=1 Tax=Kineosporia corallincola TaxID=2835133 RepID=UPI0027DEE288|nr:C4-type zinc ribbon domain-containing protein [Kineosporia corallincola]